MARASMCSTPFPATSRAPNRYPTKGEEDLMGAIAKVQNIPATNILLGCGSGELLRTAVQVFTSPTRRNVAQVVRLIPHV